MSEIFESKQKNELESSNKEELARLSEFLKLSEGFDFFILRIDSGGTLSEVLPLLRDICKDRQLIELDFTGSACDGITTVVYDKIHKLSEESGNKKNNYIFLIYGLSDVIGEKGMKTRPLEVLNEQRDLVAHEIKAPMLIVMNKEQMEQFRDKAADFFSVRSADFYFK